MSGSESDTETETAETNSTGGGCVDSSDCADPKSPVCVESVCVACTEAGFPDQACEAKDTAAPVCRGDGECVACTPTNPSACDGTTPVCDEATSACVGCSFHEQCPDSACRIATGGCFDAGNVHDVGQGMEYEGIGDAVADLGQRGEVVLRIFDGPTYNEAVTIGGAGSAYAVLAQDAGTVPLWANTMEGAPTLRVDSGAEVYVQSLRFGVNGEATFPGISVSAATLYLDRSEVAGNTGGGLALTAGAYAQIRNCFVGANGTGAPNARGIQVEGSTLDILYTTVARNDASVDDSLVCNLVSNVTARNSIFIGRDSPSINCAPLAASYSVFDEAIAGEGNENAGAIDNGWFTDVFAGDLHLTASGAAQFGDVALWTIGDPTVDIDGEPRLAEDATQDVAGGDLP